MAKAGAQGSWGGATARAAAVRDGILFAVAGVVPAILAVTLGLRAVRNEEAAVRREAAADAESAVRRAEDAVLQEIRASETRLAAIAPDKLGGAPSAVRQIVDPLTPSWSELAVLDARLEPIVESATKPQGDSSLRRDTACRKSAQAVGRGDVAVDEALVGCDGARTALGGWLVPLTLLGRLREAPSNEAAAALVAWLDTNAWRMSRAERSATQEEIAASRMTDAQRAAATRALAREGAPSSGSATIQAAVRSDIARDALARGPDARGIVRFGGEGRLGVLRVAPGGAAGFVVDGAALARALAALPPDEDSKLSAIASEPAKSDAPRAVAWLAPGLGIEASLRGADDLAARTTRARWSLWAIALGSGAVALVFALLLFSRLRAARRTSELRTSFVAAVSHELRTPIASIRMLSEILEGDRDGDEAERRETISAIARESRRLGETVSRLLAWSRMSAGRTAITRRRVVVAEVVEGAVDVFEERNPSIGVERALDSDVALAIDAPLVQLAVMNLLENAKKYAPNGQPYVVVVAPTQVGARIEVRDRGPGVPAAWRARVFEPFERGDDRLSRATDGTGIGLALVRAIARAHGGDATLGDSAEGATFVMVLRDGDAAPTAEENDPR